MIKLTKVQTMLGIGGALLTIAVSYVTLGGPVPASVGYVDTTVAQTEQFSHDTREIVLLDKLFIRQEELYKAEQALAEDPENEHLQERVFNIKRQIQLLERQLSDLDEHAHDGNS